MVSHHSQPRHPDNGPRIHRLMLADSGTAAESREIAGIASFMRPLHYMILEPGGLPLNRVAKTDYVRLYEMAKEEVTRLRAAGGWDA